VKTLRLPPQKTQRQLNKDVACGGREGEPKGVAVNGKWGNQR